MLQLFLTRKMSVCRFKSEIRQLHSFAVLRSEEYSHSLEVTIVRVVKSTMLGG
jgi:hypothetical protein